MKDRWVIAVAPLVLLALGFVLFRGFQYDIAGGANDFLMFYAGGRLAGTSHLYNPDRIHAVQIESAGRTGEALLFTRLPFLAAFLWPLAQLPYRTAYLVWEALSLGALAGFVALWRRPSLAVALLASCSFVPVLIGLANGQDVTFLLLWIALSATLVERGRPLAAGLVLSLCAAKFHLFLLAPVLVWRQRQRRFGLGLAAGVAALAVLSFATAGPDWPWQYYEVLTSAVVHPRIAHMPNLHGLLAGLRYAPLLQGLATAGIVWAHWRIVRRRSFRYGLAATLAGGILISYHAYLSDCVLLLPSGLEVASSTGWKSVRFLAVLVITPLVYFLYPSWPGLTPVATALLVAATALEAGSQETQQPCPQH